MSRIALLAAGLFFCSIGAARAQDVGSIQALNDKWDAAFNKGDAAALAAMYAEDAYVLPPGAEMVRGRAAIQDFWGGAVQQTRRRQADDGRCTEARA